MKNVSIYTDGACSGNPGVGGFGCVLIHGEHRREILGGYKLTTNNRMELIACINALEALKYECEVNLYTDSKYVVDSIEQGWAAKWRMNGWKRNKKDKAENPDLWRQLLDLCNKHKIKFEWVKGHSGNFENERCDELANEGMRHENLLEDTKYLEYQAKKELKTNPTLF
ncbi:ribonuclease HI [Desulfosediminicola sp.]|uniref:ribonuclease HI n=1 Tax=Desulfosediminicola sp. TaxID=2886825 RepID=UPI003AF22751